MVRFVAGRKMKLAQRRPRQQSSNSRVVLVVVVQVGAG
eukprot:COSAG06_NODE_15636_length_1056_cov_1.607106_1_plen_37_part_10